MRRTMKLLPHTLVLTVALLLAFPKAEAILPLILPPSLSWYGGYSSLPPPVLPLAAPQIAPVAPYLGLPPAVGYGGYPYGGYPYGMPRPAIPGAYPGAYPGAIPGYPPRPAGLGAVG